MGCFADYINGWQRDLNGLGISTNIEGGGSVELCLDYCSSKNFLYAGVQYG